MNTTVRRWVCAVLCVLMLSGTFTTYTLHAQAASDQENETAIYNYCYQVLGFNNAACCGILANIQRESWFRPNAVGDNGAAYGICQWNARKQSLINWCKSNGLNYTTLEAQLAFMRYELTQVSYFKGVYNTLRNVPDTADGAYTAGYEFCAKYEIPVKSEYTVRANLAKTTYWNKYGNIKNPVVTKPTNNAELDPANPGMLAWNAITGAVSYRYTVEQVNASDETVKTLVKGALVSGLSVSLQGIGLAGSAKYKVTVVAYSDGSGSQAMGTGLPVYFTTKQIVVQAPSLTAPAALAPVKYGNYYAAMSFDKISTFASQTFSWSATGDYYDIELHTFAQKPDLYTLASGGQSVFTAIQRTTDTQLTVAEKLLTQCEGKYLRLKITAYSNIDGAQNALPVYYYFERDVEIVGFALQFNANGGAVDNSRVFVKEQDLLTMPTATADAHSLIYDANGGRSAPAAESFIPTNIGWALSADATTAQYTAGTPYAITSDMTLYALWNANVRLSEAKPIRSGYDFLGWEVTVNGTEEVVEPGATVLIEGCRDVTLKAKWKRNYNEEPIAGIELYSCPDTVIYSVGDKFDSNGLVVKATYADNTTAYISRGLDITVPDMNHGGIYLVTVNCEGYSVEYYVFVFEGDDKTGFSRGDINLDGKIGSEDARFALRAAVQLQDVNSPLQKDVCDVDKDSRITASDARLLLRAAVRLEDISQWTRFNFDN